MEMYMDCQAAIDILQEALQAAKCGTVFEYDTDFLWADIWKHIRIRPEGCVRVIKCAAHKCWQKLVGPRQRWMAFANEQVDKKAKRSILLDHKTHHRWLQACVTKDDVRKQCYTKWINYVVTVSEYFLENKPKTDKRNEQGYHIVEP